MDKTVYTEDGLLCGHKKEWNFVTCSSVDEPEIHYAKKLGDKKVTLLYDAIHTNCPEYVKSLETVNTWVVTRGWDSEWGRTTQGYSSLWSDTNVLKWTTVMVIELFEYAKYH